MRCKFCSRPAAKFIAAHYKSHYQVCTWHAEVVKRYHSPDTIFNSKEERDLWLIEREL